MAELICVGAIELEGRDEGVFPDLACDTALQEHGGVVVDELELFENLNSLLVVGNQLEVLIRDSQLQLSKISTEDLLPIDDCVLWVVDQRGCKCLGSINGN